MSTIKETSKHLELELNELANELDDYEFTIEFWEEGSDSDLEDLKAKALKLENEIQDIQSKLLKGTTNE